MKSIRHLACLAAAMLASAAFAQTTVQITRHNGNGTGAALSVERPAADSPADFGFQALQRCKDSRQRATATVRTRDTTCKVMYRDTYVPPPVTCERVPDPQVERRACPAGTTGEQTRTTRWTVGSPPQCVRASVQGPWEGVCTPVVTPPVDPPVANAIYFSPSGNDSNPGTQASPKRIPNSAQVNSAPAGTQFLLKRGETWTWPMLTVFNRNATAAAPIVIGAYGTGACPRLQTSGGNAFYVGDYNSQALREGNVTIRDVCLDGMGTAATALQQGWMTQGITLDNVTIERFTIAMNVGVDTNRFTLRNSIIRNNVQHGVLGAGADWLIENNLFERNGDARAPGTHALYFSAHLVTNGSPARGQPGSDQPNNDRLVVRNNTFRNNSQSGGVCMSGNLTVHGRTVGGLIEGNTFGHINDRFGWPCRSISLTAGYGEPEYMRDFIVRNNRIVNAGGIAWSAAPGLRLEGNTVIDTVLRQGNDLIAPAGNAGSEDERDTLTRAQGAVGNVICNTGVCAQ